MWQLAPGYAPLPLQPRERAILGDLHAATLLTTNQICRLRFPGTSATHCRQRLHRLMRRGLITFLPATETRGMVRDRCWVLTADGTAALGLGEDGESARAAVDAPRMERLLNEADAYVERQIAEWVARIANPVAEPSDGAL